jgi:hypothetical protein
MRERNASGVDCLPEGKAQPVLAYQTNHTKSGAPESEWVTRARWHFSDRKESGQRVHLVGQSDRNAYGGRWTRVAWPEWFVVVGDGVSHSLILAII